MTALIFDVCFTPNIRHSFDSSTRQLGANDDTLHRRKKVSLFTPDNRNVGHQTSKSSVLFCACFAGMIPLETGQMQIGIGRRQFISALGDATLLRQLAALADRPTTSLPNRVASGRCSAGL
jgi:hypothetical protein